MLALSLWIFILYLLRRLIVSRSFYQDFQLRKVKRILKKINALKEKMESLSDQELAEIGRAHV